jgi:hypothetical protein
LRRLFYIALQRAYFFIASAGAAAGADAAAGAEAASTAAGADAATGAAGAAAGAAGAAAFWPQAAKARASSEATRAIRFIVVSLREVEIKVFKACLAFEPFRNGMDTKSRAANFISSAKKVQQIGVYKPSLVVDMAGWEDAHISRKRDFSARAFSGSFCARMPRGSSKWKRRT